MRPYEKQRRKGKKEHGGAAREKGKTRKEMGDRTRKRGCRGGEGKLY